MMTVSTLRPAWANALVALAFAFMLGVTATVPASAETAGQVSTRNIILAATAVTLGIVMYNNLEHKTGAYSVAVGYTSDGGRVYADGRIVFGDGTIVYSSNDGYHRCSYDGRFTPCRPHARGYAWRYEGEKEWHGEGLHKGWYKGHGNPHHDEDEEEGGHDS